MTMQVRTHCATSSTRATSATHARVRGAMLAAPVILLVASFVTTRDAGATAPTRPAVSVDASQPASAAFLQACVVPGVERVRCGRFPVPENRAKPDARTIGLNVVVLEAETTPRAPDALFILQGGPGQAASNLAEFYARTFAGLRQERDIVLVDQRGTGGSHPLDCRLGGSKADPGAYLGDIMPVEQVRACRGELEEDADLTQYATTMAVADLEAVRDALGYAQIDLYGTSYGTRVALVYTRAHAGRVRAIVLKGVAPMSMVIPAPFAADSQRALDQLFDDCAANRDCAGAYPQLRSEFASLLASLRKGPVPVNVEVRGADAPRPYPLEVGPFGAFVRTVLQSTGASKDLPLIIHDAARGDWLPFTRLAVAVREEASHGLHMGMFLSVACTEDAPLLDAHASTDDAFLGDYWVRSLLAACREWPRGSVPDGFREAVRSDVPVLLVSGYLDSAAPPRWAEDAARTLPNSRQVVVRYGSHSFSGLAGCVDEIMTAFVQRASVKDLNDDCVRTVARPPFTLPRADRTPSN